MDKPAVLAVRASAAIACTFAMVLTAAAPHAAEKLEREMNVRQGPESVFDRPVGQIVPALEGAQPSGANGRVGPELVFWGYNLADGRKVAFFACAQRRNVDCMSRLALVCPAPASVLETRETTGKVAQRVCRPVSSGIASEIRPGCDDYEDDRELLVGLVQCGG